MEGSETWEDREKRITERLRDKKTEKHGSKDSRGQSHRVRNAGEQS